MTKRNSFGNVRKLPSGSFQARYKRGGEWHKALTTFRTKGEALDWLAGERKSIANESWVPPTVREQHRETERAALAAKERAFGEFADEWVSTRTNRRGEKIKPRTAHEYNRLLTTGPLSHWRERALNTIKSPEVRSWYNELRAVGADTQTSRAYSLFKSIMSTAVDDELIEKNPCNIKGGDKSTTGKNVLPPTDEQLDKIIDLMPDRLKPFVALAASGGIRFGELTALTTDDVELVLTETHAIDCIKIAVNKGVTYVPGQGRKVGPPKSEEGIRDVLVFGNDAKLIADYVGTKKPGELLWTGKDGGYMPHATLNYYWGPAREAVGRPDLNFHSLRHYAGTRYAQIGATMRETMSRLGHRTTEAAMRYQHSGSRDAELARRAARG